MDSMFRPLVVVIFLFLMQALSSCYQSHLDKNEVVLKVDTAASIRQKDTFLSVTPQFKKNLNV